MTQKRKIVCKIGGRGGGGGPKGVSNTYLAYFLWDKVQQNHTCGTFSKFSGQVKEK